MSIIDTDLMCFYFTPGEAVHKMLQEKKMSSKLNYDVLKNLSFDSQSDLVPVISSTPAPIESKRCVTFWFHLFML